MVEGAAVLSVMTGLRKTPLPMNGAIQIKAVERWRDTLRTKPKESEIQRAILDYLTARKIWHMRLNTGAMSGSHKGKRWFVKFGKPGMADIVSTIKNSSGGISIVWIEVKRPGGKQTEDQLRFEQEVYEAGHNYLLVESVEQLMVWFK